MSRRTLGISEAGSGCRRVCAAACDDFAARWCVLVPSLLRMARLYRPPAAGDGRRRPKWLRHASKCDDRSALSRATSLARASRWLQAVTLSCVTDRWHVADPCDFAGPAGRFLTDKVAAHIICAIRPREASVITIELNSKTRAQMNSGTPRSEDWTYHHVLPVRYYFTLASVCAHMVADDTLQKATRKLAKEVLRAMPCNGGNADKVETFCSEAKSATGIPLTDRAAKAVAVARLCASPLWGGFAGMAPSQRCDDPGSNPEPNRPLSGGPDWWSGLQLLQARLDALVPTLSGQSDEKDFTLQIDENKATGELQAIAQHVNVLKPCPILPFKPTDWKLCPTENPNFGRPWIYGKRGATGPAWTAVASFDSLNRIKAKGKEFGDAWRDQRDAFGGVFALRTATTDPQGAAADYDAELHTKAMEKKVYRQINDLLVLYLPTTPFV